MAGVLASALSWPCDSRVAWLRGGTMGALLSQQVHARLHVPVEFEHAGLTDWQQAAVFALPQQLLVEEAAELEHTSAEQL